MKRYLVLPILLSLLVIPVICGDDVTVNAEVQSYLEVTLSYTSIDFGTLTAGSEYNYLPNQDLGWYNATVNANSEYQVTFEPTDLTYESYTISKDNFCFCLNVTQPIPTDFLQANCWGDYATVADIACINTTAGVTNITYTDIPYNYTINYHGFWLTIPSGQHAGTYTGTITITYSLV